LNNILKFFIVFTIVTLSVKSKAQDTITVMHYNLLYYGLNTDFCTSTNNNISQKEQNFKKIIKYVNPQIVTVNEMDASATIANRFLTNVLNTDGISYYKRADFYNTAGSNTINMLYYDSRKLKYHSHFILSSYVRDIDLYKLYHNSPDLSATHDTTFIYCAVAHLKAGNTDSDLQARKLMTQYAMGNLNTMGINSNIMFMGDLNTKSSSENCFQNLITHSNANIRFYDPVNMLGNWYDNSNYKNYHTQSTNVSSNNCHSGGGLDDRFDFILINNAIKNNTLKVHYINNSYQALGQDGQRFNSSIIYPTNTLVPSAVANALYAASDHLPVVLNLLVDRPPASIYNETAKQNTIINFSVQNNHLHLEIYTADKDVFSFNHYTPCGMLVNTVQYPVENGYNSFVLNDLMLFKGLNIIQILSKDKTYYEAIKVVSF